MSISTINPSPGGGFNKNKNNKDSMITGATATSTTSSTATAIPHAPKSIEELNAVCLDLIKGYQHDASMTPKKSYFWMSKAKESMDSFNDSLNDYLVKKNEKNLINVDFDCMYVYYHACKLILQDIVPTLFDFPELQNTYDELMTEFYNNDMYFAEIKGEIESRQQQQQQQQSTADILAARFNNLKRSFSSSTKPQVSSSYTLLQPSSLSSSSASSTPTPNGNKLNSLGDTKASFSKNSDLSASIPRSGSPILLQSDHESSRNDFLQSSDSSSSLLTPVVTPIATQVSNFNLKSLQSPQIKAVTRLKSPPPVPAHFKSRSASPIRRASSNGFFANFNNRTAISPIELNELVAQYPTSILVIDYRSTSEFDNRHIYFANSSNVIHIDPLTVGIDYKAIDIETSSMLTNSDHERKLFKDRNMFEMVVIYDQDSLNIESNRKMQILVDILYSKNSDKPLLRNPFLLSGGLNAWIKLYGAVGVASNLGIIRDDLSIEVRNDTLSRPTMIPSKQSGDVNYYKNTNNSYSSTSLSSFEKSNYNRSHTDFFSQQSQGKLNRSSTVSPQPMAAPAISKFGNKNLPALDVDIDRPKSAICSPRKNSSSSNDSMLLEAQKRQQQINKFDNNLIVITGIANMGNTCYMNCILQCLVGTKGLTRFFLMNDYQNKINFKSKLGSKGMISKAFHGVVSDMYSRSVTDFQKRCFFITPQRFKQTIGALNADFRGFQQQDCSEFLNFLLDSLHEDLNQRGDTPKFPPLTAEEESHREKMSIRLASSIEWEKYLKTDFSSIVEFFQGQYLSRLQCTVCHTTSTTYNAFSTLSIPIPEHVKGPVTLEQCFEEFCKTEILDGDERWFCPNCARKQKTTKTMRISILPKNLIIHLKRFKISHIVTKLNTFVNYPLEISLLKYWPAAETESDKFKMRNFPDRGQHPPFDYKLYGVVNHFGSLRSGHYTSFVDKSDATKNGWCYFDDTTVTKNCHISKVINENAYVLFYRRV